MQAAGDEGRLRVVAQFEAVYDPGAYGDDVLERAAQLDAGQIVTAVDAKGRRRKSGLGPFRGLKAGERHRRRRRLAGRYLPGQVRSGEGADGRRRQRPRFFADELRHAPTCFDLYALRRADDQRVRGHGGGYRPNVVAHRRRGNGDENEVGP